MNAVKLSNPSVGDAICVFLLFELALHYLKMDYRDTLKLYTDLESLTSKIAVKTKENLKVTPIEDKVVEPAELQAASCHRGYFGQAQGQEGLPSGKWH